MIFRNTLRRILISIIAFVIPLGCLSACQEIRIDASMDKNVLLNVGTETCSMYEAIFGLLEEKEQYELLGDPDIWSRDIGEETMADYVKDSVKNEMIRNTTCLLMADDKAMYLTDEQEALAKEDASQAYNRINEKYDLSKYGITLDTVQRVYDKRAVYKMLYENLSADISKEISDSDTKVIKVSYAYVPVEDGYDSALKIREEVDGGEGFEYACEQAGYDPEINKVISRGDMSESFERVAFALVDGEMSEVVEDGKNGYYVILCLEDYMVAESIANKNKVLTEAKSEIFDREYADFTSSKKLQFNTHEWEKISIGDL